MIETLIESARGCGYRKPKGLYMVGGKFGSVCGKLPIPLTVCPCCHGGIKFSRGFTWVGKQLISGAPCRMDNCGSILCTLAEEHLRERYGLMWVGEKFYNRPIDFMREGQAQGISKRIAAVPKDFKVGEDWILLAHRKAIRDHDFNGEDSIEHYTPGIFQAFKPTRIEYVVAGDETPEELERLVKRGITPVHVIKDTDVQLMIEENHG